MGIFGNIWKLYGNIWKYMGIIWEYMGIIIYGNYMGIYGNRNYMGIIWNYMEIYRLIKGNFMALNHELGFVFFPIEAVGRSLWPVMGIAGILGRNRAFRSWLYCAMTAIPAWLC